MKELSATEYQKLAHPTSFMQTVEMAKQRKSQGQTTHFFEHNSEFALLSATPYPGNNSKYYNYNIWFPNQLSETFISELRTWCKNHHGLSLTITPNTPITHRDNHGKILKEFPFNPTIFTDNHFHWQGEILLAPGVYKQWQYIIPLTSPYPKLLKTFKPKVRHGIATAAKTGITIEKLDSKNLSAFVKTLDSTAQRKHFSSRDQKYYANLLESFGNQAYGLIAYLDPTKTKKLLESTIKNSKNQKDDTDIAQKARRQLEIIANLKEKTPIYAGFFIDTKVETVHLSGGGPDRFFPFSPAFAILDHAIRSSVSHKIPRFNLYGVDATFDHPTGLLRFKQQFQGFIEQLPGDYITTFRPLTTTKLKIQNHLKR